MSGGGAAGPLAGARAHPSESAPPLSGLTAVPGSAPRFCTALSPRTTAQQGAAAVGFCSARRRAAAAERGQSSSGVLFLIQLGGF